MSDVNVSDAPGDGMRRVRLAEWAKQRGIARITAYRMLQRGILPVPAERSPTGRWYVLVPEHRSERMAFYTRATRGPNQALVLNDQIAALSEWAASHRGRVHVVVKEVATPLAERLPKLAQLLADHHITEIVVESPDVVGEAQFHLLVAALASQGRTLTAAYTESRRRRGRSDDLQAAIAGLLMRLYGAQRGTAAARRAFDAR